MTNTLYRFRPIEYILSSDDLGYQKDPVKPYGFDELRKNQLYLSPMENLNDPMEGYKNLYWKGDKVIWNNFFKHYAMCLTACMCQATLHGPSYRVTRQDIPIHQSHRRSNDDIVKSVITSLASCEHVLGYIEAFAEAKRKIHKNELRFYLSTINMHITDFVRVAFAGLDPSLTPIDASLSKKTLLSKSAISRFLSISETSAIEEKNAQISVKENEFKLATMIKSEPWGQVGANITYDFPSLYLDAIEDLLYPKALIACLSERFDNPSMWSHYSRNHSGICLQFTTDGKTFPVNTIVGIGGTATNTKYDVGLVNLTLHKVTYDQEYPETDFFNSLGQLPIPTLNSAWLYDDEGNRSSCLNQLTNDEGTWRQKYWEHHPSTVTKKLSDWEYESEFRAISTSGFNQDIVSKNTTYNFDNLDGIIFGMQTKDDYKTKIIEIIKEKCDTANRSCFNFYQAYYNPKTNRVEKVKLEKISQFKL
ncbi:DUF2971 domain-containing protein [Thalassospira sp. ER-Se-21-Dark]|uniref:DUF2971 domain-containing protein n=1 Tax=Thalassospira sp. ER-Se-21-Dark TaxID=2585190 RepID=UPI001B304238|nr:DUF2971 domain-containing protein [Thalassospira sp. ER-Se-21-Dark]MBP3127763.1 DUF2971 domain-containing protein [Thalassospira sp. ER-Se-21-Dark]